MTRSDRSSPGHRPPRFFLRPSHFHLEAGRAELDPDAVHHLRQVLRLGQGAQVELFDGSGREYLAEVIESRPSRVELRILSVSRPEVESPIRITLAQALLKGNALDRVLTDAAELGVQAIVPILSRRTVVQTKAAEAEAKIRRWEKILEAAAAQSGRVVVPKIEYPTLFLDFLQREFAGMRLILWEGAPPSARLPETTPAAIALLAGPEGGFEEEEVKAAEDAGFILWSLGPRILRADTAGPAAIAVLQYRYGDGQKPAGKLT